MKIARIIHCMLFVSSYTLWASDRILKTAAKKYPISLYAHGLHCKPDRVNGLVQQNIIQQPYGSVAFNDTQSCLGRVNKN